MNEPVKPVLVSATASHVVRSSVSARGQKSGRSLMHAEHDDIGTC